MTVVPDEADVLLALLKGEGAGLSRGGGGRVPRVTGDRECKY